MGMNKALFDSNIIIYLSKRILPLSVLDQFDEHFISIITYMEVLGNPFKDSKTEDFIKEILEAFPILYINKEIAETAIKFRKAFRIKLPDAIIAATAKSVNLQLVTGNTDDFNKSELPIINPFA